MWPLSTSSSSTRTTPLISYGGLSHTEMGMFVVAPATSFQHTSTHDVLIPSSSSSSSDLHHPFASSNAAASAATALGVGVIPFLTAAPYLNMGGGSVGDGDLLGGNRSRPAAAAAGAGGMQLWQGQQHPNHYQQQASYLKMGTDTINFNQSSTSLLASGSGARGGGSFTCQDCGNQAKKDCSHRRCRTCCKSRGFDCSTHLKSTWVSAARRRERQNMAVVGVHGGGGGASTGSTSGAIKKPRLSQNTNTTTSHTSTSNNTPPRSFDTSSSHQDASLKESSLPGQVRAPAVFRCVRVTAIDDGGDPEFAYQAVVKINGHVFKGFLYDQGRVDHHQSRDSFPNLSELHLGSSSSGGGGRNGGASPPLDSSTNVYGSAAVSAGGLYGGACAFGNNTIN